VYYLSSGTAWTTSWRSTSGRARAVRRSACGRAWRGAATTCSCCRARAGRCGACSRTRCV